jgi:uncharacterized protein YraI
VLPMRSSVRVNRCLAGWTWCEVSVGRRGSGWVDARFLRPSPQGRVPLVHNQRRPGRPPQPGHWPQRPAG